MCFRLKHFPADHSDRTSLTPAVVSDFKVHEMRQRPRIRLGELTALPRAPSWIRGGERDKERWELGKEGRETEARGRGNPSKFREKLTPLPRLVNVVALGAAEGSDFASGQGFMLSGCS